MASQNIGVVIGANSGTVYAVVNPDDDSELDNPRWLLIRGETEAMRLILVPRGDYEGALSMADVAQLVDRLK